MDKAQELIEVATSTAATPDQVLDGFTGVLGSFWGTVVAVVFFAAGMVYKAWRVSKAAKKAE